MLTPRWTPLRYHEGQHAYMTSTARFNVLPCGRRSGKTERAKRKLVIKALEAIKAIQEGTWPWHNARFFAAAPTFAQAKRIYWADLKALIPPQYMAGKPKESDLIIPLKGDVEIHVLGMDKPERFEGSPWNGGVLDEYANMHAEAWGANIRPGLSDRQGWCDLIGVPEGRNHYYEMYKTALADKTGEWAVFSWPSSDIVDAAEIESARRMLDDLTFKQEYEASFVSFTGRAYYNFDDATHTSKALTYNPHAPLIFCFDFNVSPGVAVVLQEQVLPGCFERVPNPRLFRGPDAFRLALLSQQPDAFVRRPVTGTGVIGEVYIPQNSTTPAVCHRLIQDWGDHQGEIICYGDASGGAAGSAKVRGSDWEIIDQTLRQHYGSRVELQVPRANPSERSRVNAVNARLKTADGTVLMLLDSERCPHLITDFEGVRVLEGGSGEIDKKRDKRLTHMCFAGETLLNGKHINALPESGTVHTMFGPARFTNPGVRGYSELVELVFEDGGTVRCTPDHQIMTAQGWKPAVACLDAFGYFVSQKEASEWAETASPLTAHATFGTGAIMGLRTASGIMKKALVRPCTSGATHTDAASADGNIRQPEKSRAFAQEVVRQRLAAQAELTTSSRPASNAETSSAPTSTSSADSAPGSVRRIIAVRAVPGRHPVYCPTVETGHFCLDNGLVVSNSDAIGYYIAYEFPVVADQELAEMPIVGRY